MFSHFALTKVSPTITHANTQADTGSQWVSRVMKLLAVLPAIFLTCPPRAWAKIDRILVERDHPLEDFYATASVNPTSVTAGPELGLDLGRPISTVREHIIAGVALVQ